MATNTIKTRIQHKNGSASDWSQAITFVPLKGELIIYNDAAMPKIKIGDGTTLVENLPFIGASITINGAITSTPSLYAPTSAGTTGQVLKSQGSGKEPIWATEYSYTLPTASSSTLGGVKIGTGIAISSGVISNSGVRSIETGSTNGTISVNTNGTTAEIAVKGLGSNAYTSTSYLPLAGGTLTGALNTCSVTVGSSSSTSFYSLNIDRLGKDGTNSGRMRTYIAADGNFGVIDFLYNGTSVNSLKMYDDGRAVFSGKLYGAVWNDYAEFRTTVLNAKPGQVLIENGDGSLRLSTERLQPGCEIVSDTFGFAIGETDKCKTPIAVSGRVLAYTYEDRNTFIAGEPVCSGPNGTVSHMTREEAKEYPERIIGTVSEIPSYERWGTGDVEINGRIWIRIK